MRKCDQGLFSAVYEDGGGGKLAGFLLRAAKEWERPQFAEASACAIPASEMQIYAFRRFKDARSATAGMSEMEKLTRVHPKFGFPLPPEDRVELVAAKMKYYRTTFEMTADKVSPKRPKRLAGMKHPIGSLAGRNLPGEVFILRGKTAVEEC